MNTKIIYCLLATVMVLMQGCQKNAKNYDLADTSQVSTSSFQGFSLLGDSLTTQIDSVAQKDQLEKLKQSKSAFSDNPTVENMIWIGRREAYLGRYDLAIATFSNVILDWPNDFEPYRHRGHRYITLRDFEKATKDFHKAAVLMEGKPIKVEQDGIPNKLNVPLSNVQFNVYYHLGLAYYLQGEYEEALEAYESCLQVSDNDDLKVATLDWYFMTLMKMGRKEEARKIIEQVHKNMQIIEKEAYFKRILMYKGELKPELLLETSENESDQMLQNVTQGYGLGNYYLSLGDTSNAKAHFENVLKSGYWAAFGYIASEFELSKIKNE